MACREEEVTLHLNLCINWNKWLGLRYAFNSLVLGFLGNVVFSQYSRWRLSWHFLSIIESVLLKDKKKMLTLHCWDTVAWESKGSSFWFLFLFILKNMLVYIILPRMIHSNVLSLLWMNECDGSNFTTPYMLELLGNNHWWLGVGGKDAPPPVKFFGKIGQIRGYPLHPSPWDSSYPRPTSHPRLGNPGPGSTTDETTYRY